MNESFPRLPLSFSLLALPFTFYVPKGVERRQQRQRKRRNRENLLLLLLRSFRNDWFARLPGHRVPRKKGRRRERARKKEDRKKAGVTSLETRSVKRNTRTRVANNETKRGGRGGRRNERRRKRRWKIRGRRKTWTRFNGAFKFFRFFLEGEGNNWGRKGIDPGEEREERA